ncbi:MAG: hypothetical protein AAFQ41_04815 [Cyanobacteria bacterium J06623_7]
MATIIKHRRTGYQYILLRVNGESNKTNPSRFISELFEREKPDVSCSATVCDALGNIFIADIDDLIILEIDGIKPAEILPEASYEPTNSARDNFASQTSTDFESDLTAEADEEWEDDPDFAPLADGQVVEDSRDSLDAPDRDDNDDEGDWI